MLHIEKKSVCDVMDTDKSENVNFIKLLLVNGGIELLSHVKNANNITTVTANYQKVPVVVCKCSN